MALCGLYVSGCAKQPQLHSPEAKLRGRVVSVEGALEKARLAGAEDTWEYGEALRLLKDAGQLADQGDFEGAEKLLSEAEINAVMALGSAKDRVYMSGVDETAQEFRKSMLEKSFSGETSPTPGVADVFFEFDSSRISGRTRGILDRNAAFIATGTDGIEFVLVTGFCDTRGTEEYNLSLGKKRAEQVRKYMIGRGIPPSMIYSVSRGETDIWQKGTSEESYRQNRRAHFRVLFR